MTRSACHSRRVIEGWRGHSVLPVVLGLCALAGSPANAQLDPRIQDVLRRQEETVSLIRELSLRMDIEIARRGESGDRKQELSYVWHWSRAENKIRLLTNPEKVRVDGWPENGDVLIDRKTKVARGLANWGKRLPRPLKPWDSGAVIASVDEEFLLSHPFLESNFVTERLLFIFMRPRRPDSPDEPVLYDLPRDFVQRAQRVEYAELPEGDRPLIRLRCSWDAFQTQYSDLFFDPNAGCLVRKAVSVDLSSSPGRGGGVAAGRKFVVGVMEANEFRKFDDGVFFPVSLHVRSYYVDDPDQVKTSAPQGEASITVANLIVNQALPKDAFDFRFPENVLVRFYPPKDGGFKTMLWGPNNQPLRQIRSVKDLEALARAEALAPRRRLWGAIAVAVAAAAILAGVSIWIRRRRTA
jgi:hypothetical protein